MAKLRVKRVILSGVLLMSLTGCTIHVMEKTTDQFYKSQQPNLVKENFVIKTIDDNNNAYAELITNDSKKKGQGIFYPKNDLYNSGLTHVNIGDKIAVYWTEKDYKKQNWKIYQAENIK